MSVLSAAQQSEAYAELGFVPQPFPTDLLRQDVTPPAGLAALDAALGRDRDRTWRDDVETLRRWSAESREFEPSMCLYVQRSAADLYAKYGYAYLSAESAARAGRLWDGPGEPGGVRYYRARGARDGLPGHITRIPENPANEFSTDFKRRGYVDEVPHTAIVKWWPSIEYVGWSDWINDVDVYDRETGGEGDGEEVMPSLDEVSKLLDSKLRQYVGGPLGDDRATVKGDTAWLKTRASELADRRWSVTGDTVAKSQYAEIVPGTIAHVPSLSALAALQRTQILDPHATTSVVLLSRAEWDEIASTWRSSGGRFACRNGDGCLADLEARRQ